MFERSGVGTPPHYLVYLAAQEDGNARNHPDLGCGAVLAIHRRVDIGQ